MLLFDIGLAVTLFACELTWFGGPLFGGKVMRNGAVFHGDAASIVAVGVDGRGEPLIPLGTRITICKPSLSVCAEAIVQDTGLLGDNLDGSPALFQKFAPLRKGRIDVLYLVETP